MVRFFQLTTDYPHTWDRVTLAIFNKYPNPYSTHVLTSDVIDRYVLGNTLITKRLLKKQSKVPRWGQYILKMDEAYILETSVVNLETNEMTMKTRNLSHRKIMLIEENLVIKQHSDISKNTEIITKVRFISNTSFLKGQIEAFGLHRFRNSVKTSSAGLLHVLNQ
jgi:imidazoleglycerol phosphate dehydratase HisB